MLSTDSTAYFDESRVEPNHAVSVVAGFVSTTDMWCSLDEQWKKLLNDKPPALNWKNYVQQNAVRFAKLARANTLKAISCPIDQAKFNAATPVKSETLEKLRSMPRVERLAGVLVSPYTFGAMVCCEVLDSWARKELKEKIPPLKVVFDDGATHRHLFRRGYEEYYRSQPSTYLSRNLNFEDDNEFLPLQAAHLYAWLLSGWLNGKRYSEALDVIGEGGHVIPTRAQPTGSIIS